MTTTEDPRPQTPTATHRQGPHNGDPDPCPKCDGSRKWRTHPRNGVDYYKAVCLTCEAETSKNWRANNRQLSRQMVKDRRLVRVYGITREQRDDAIMTRNGLCDICGKRPGEHWKMEGERILHIDHDHETGKLRGMLCGQCNKKLAWLEEFRAEALAYLDNPPGLMPHA